MIEILGHHHISMLTKDAKLNKEFYVEKLGLRLYLKTVNQDDPSMYHLFYGDEVGSPGTSLTFFELKPMGQTYKGTNSISRIGLLVPSEESLNYWKDRFEKLDVDHDAIGIYNGMTALHFEIMKDWKWCYYLMVNVKCHKVGVITDTQMYRKNIKLWVWVL